MWSSISHATVQHSEGLYAISKLVQLDVPPELQLNYSSGFKHRQPDLQLILYDIFHQERLGILDQSVGSMRDDSVGCLELIASLLEGTASAHQAGRVLSAFTVKPTSAGLELCGLQAAQGHSLGITTTTHRLKEYDSVVSTAGAITCPHIDSPLSASTIFTIFGHKLWFVWPPTEKNLTIYSPCLEHLPPTTSGLLRYCLDRLEGLQTWISRPGEAFLLAPGVIHAIVTLENCSITGYKLFQHEAVDTMEALSCSFLKMNHAYIPYDIDRVMTTLSEMKADAQSIRLHTEHPLTQFQSEWKALDHAAKQYLKGRDRY